MQVCFYEAFEEEEEGLRRCLPPSVQAGFTSSVIQESGHPGPPAPLISIRTQSRIPSSWLPELKGILARSTGYDHLLAIQPAVGPRVLLASIPEYCSRAVAEQAALLWMALLRRLPRQMAQGARFERDGLTGGECLGRTLTIVGVGRIGHEIARLGAGLGMRVLGVDLVPRHPDVTYVAPAEGLAAADVLCCAMNLTDQNAGYFTPARLASMKPGSLFINVARGEFVRLPDLLRALREGPLAGAGLDVYEGEPHLAATLRAGRDSEETRLFEALRQHPNVILTPHNAFNTQEALRLKCELSMEQVTHFLAHGCFRWPLGEI